MVAAGWGQTGQGEQSRSEFELSKSWSRRWAGSIFREVTFSCE
jgi:hypothetical protein